MSTNISYPYSVLFPYNSYYCQCDQCRRATKVLKVVLISYLRNQSTAVQKITTEKGSFITLRLGLDFQMFIDKFNESDSLPKRNSISTRAGCRFTVFSCIEILINMDDKQRYVVLDLSIERTRSYRANIKSSTLPLRVGMIFVCLDEII